MPISESDERRRENRNFAQEEYRFHVKAAIGEGQVGARAYLLLAGLLAIIVVVIRPETEAQRLIVVGFAIVLVVFGAYLRIDFRRALSRAKDTLVNKLSGD